MDAEFFVRLFVKVHGRTPHELYSLLCVAFENSKLRRADFGSQPSMTHPDSSNPETSHMHVGFVASDDDEVRASVQAVVRNLRIFDIDVADEFEILSVKEVKPRTVSTSGVSYDEASRTLRVDTWAPEWGNVKIGLHAEKDGRIIAILTGHEHGRYVEQALIVSNIEVQRAGGDVE